MSSMTAIRIRGKRTATTDEKWHNGKTRTLNPSRTPSERGSSVASSSSSSKRRRRKPLDPLLSRLEQLPTEILQTIFEFSCNPELPLASPRFASQLNSPHLYRELTSRTLQPVLGTLTASNTELVNAERLLNSRFFTWPFFEEWLNSEFTTRDMHAEWKWFNELPGPVETLDEVLKSKPPWTWGRLYPDKRLLPPKKLLRGPFTDDKVRLLSALSSTFDHRQHQRGPTYLELAREGLKQAVTEGATDAVGCFWQLGLRVDTELLRLAVIHAGCKKEIVHQLVTSREITRSDLADVDFLDPALWSWAEKARARGDERGPWLIDLLKRKPRRWDSLHAQGRAKNFARYVRLRCPLESISTCPN